MSTVNQSLGPFYLQNFVFLAPLKGRSPVYEVDIFHGSAYSGWINFLIENSFRVPVGGPTAPAGRHQPGVTTAFNIWYRTLRVRYGCRRCNLTTTTSLIQRKIQWFRRLPFWIWRQTLQTSLDHPSQVGVCRSRKWSPTPYSPRAVLWTPWCRVWHPGPGNFLFL